MRATESVADARRAMEICNACRYCEGYCAVFPAMELHRAFTDADLGYLANLCHGCRGCYYSCQYAPPHEFGINLPKTFAEVRAESWADYAWPRPLAAAFARNGVVVSAISAAAVALVLVAAAPRLTQGAFYDVIPFGVMVAVGVLTFGFALLAMAMGFRNFWRDAGAGLRPEPGALARAVHDALTLRYLGGGGHGCNDRDEGFSGTRRLLHHAMFYGFTLCFAATCVATVYHHFLGWQAPYALLSAPVILGTIGGVGMLVGTAGLFRLKLIGDTEPTARNLLGADVALLFLLAMVAATGLALLALRSTSGMATALCIHLGFVLALFLLLPYSRFVHGVYRFAALLRFALEK